MMYATEPLAKYDELLNLDCMNGGDDDGDLRWVRHREAHILFTVGSSDGCKVR
jgi:hypothetical protein